MPDPVAILRQSPDGWWYHSVRNYGNDTEGSWHGPFGTSEEAEKMARALEPDREKTVTIVRLAKWQTLEVEL